MGEFTETRAGEGFEKFTHTGTKKTNPPRATWILPVTEIVVTTRRWHQVITVSGTRKEVDYGFTETLSGTSKGRPTSPSTQTETGNSVFSFFDLP